MCVILHKEKRRVIQQCVMTVSVYSGRDNFDNTIVLYFIQETVAAFKNEIV